MSVKERFVREILQDEGRRLLRNQSLAIERKLQVRSGRLLGTRKIDVQDGNTYDGRLSFSHTVYERFLDMRRLHLGSQEVRRNRKIHNRFIFGHFSSIASRLMYELTDDVVARIREQIKSEDNG